MCKAVLQNRTALHVLTAAEGGECGITETECVYSPDYDKNIIGLLTDIKKIKRVLFKTLLSL